MIHKQNYCAKRCISSRSSSTTSRSSSPSSASISSVSRSPSPRSTSANESINDETLVESYNTISSTNKNIKIVKETQNTDQASEKPSDNIQLVKSIIYQCNSCLFQTDKKSIMNRHSRVHLAQKRKQMEEPNDLNKINNQKSSHATNKLGESSKISGTQSVEKSIKSDNMAPGINSSTVNDKSQSYCTDCDIQFSSITTFQHHRNNYCQKYKTIEAIVPVDMISNNKLNQESNYTQEKVSN
jgi:hypothetical protein